MSEEKKPLSWQDNLARVLIPGILLAVAGTWGECAITRISNQAENGRLVTELQIQREQAESGLRKDIFQHAVQALIAERKTDDVPKLVDVMAFSKRLLKLELLALNFGDSINVSPLFTDFERDLNLLSNLPGASVHVSKLRERLRSVAKRVASSQISFLSQRGKSIRIEVPLRPDGKAFTREQSDYKWPDDQLIEQLGDELCDDDTQSPGERSLGELLFGWLGGGEAPAEPTCLSFDEIRPEVRKRGTMVLDEVERYVIISFSDPDPDQMKVHVYLEICKLPESSHCEVRRDDTVQRDFTLDYFNFPTIDNARLSENQRFALILEEFSVSKTRSENSNDSATGKRPKEPMLSLAAVIFPSEYASLRDRPTMRESLDLLQKAQEHSDSTEEEPE